jgi:hypothetical protein
MADHNFVKKLLDLDAKGKVPQTPGVWHTDVRHDDWCGYLRGRRCNCDPVIRFLPKGQGENPREDVT